MIKVLITGPDLRDPGGVANYYNAVLPHLRVCDLDVTYLQIGRTRSNGRYGHFLVDQFRLWRAIRKIAPDLVHVNPSLDIKSFLRDGLFIFIAKAHRLPVLVFFRGWQTDFEKKVSGYLKVFFSRTYAKADSFIVLAVSFSRVLRSWGIVRPVVTGTTAVDDQLLSGLSIERKIANSKVGRPINLLYLARLEKQKGVLELLGAVKALCRSGVDVRLTIAGTGAAEEEIRAMLEGFGEDKDIVRLAGYVRGSNKAHIFETHDVYCFPTQYGEGMPNSVLEAMAFGMPIVTCPVGGIADFFEDGKMGLLLNDVVPAAIADAMLPFLSDRAALERMARYNHEYALKHFLASKAAEFLRDRYIDMLGTDESGRSDRMHPGAAR